MIYIERQTMDKVLRNTRRRFGTALLLLTGFIVVSIWGVLQLVNITQIGTNATAEEVQKTSAHSKELAAYMDDQKAYKAHFVTLASVIKEQEKDRLTLALGATAIGVLAIGIIVVVFVTRQLMKPVIEAYASQERFLQDAAHELRNPLAALTIALQQHKQDAASTKRLIDTFTRQTRRLVQINEDLLFLERKGQSKLTSVNLTDLLMDVLEDVSLSANRKKIKLYIKENHNVVKTIVASDYVRILKNLLDNAIKYSHEKSTVEISQVLDHGHIKITISDRGIGIPSSDLHRIGNRFFRAKNVGIVDGTGLGVAIIQKILNSYGGKISITSIEGKGTTVTLTIPS